MQSKSLQIFLVASLLIGIVAGVDALWIEPDWIEVTHHRVVSPLASPLKIAHLTDIHTHGLGRREFQTLALLKEEQPDVIVITGDSIFNGDFLGGWRRPKHLRKPVRVEEAGKRFLVKDDGGRYALCHEFLQRLQAPLGVWLVLGNWEHVKPIGDRERFYKSAGVNLLLNAGRQLREDVWLLGFDDAVHGEPSLDKAMEGIPANVFKIALFHSPIYFEKVAGHCDLALSGHTHGGQVRLPFVKPFWLPPGCGEFLEGWYEQEGSKMYVSRGIGTSALDIRFLCRPEIAIITLEREPRGILTSIP